MPESRFGFNLQGIAELLKLRKLAVPLYQRAYSWGGDAAKDHVVEFWSDLHSTFVRPDQEYFLGTVVLSREGTPDRDTIIDGQQRVATTAILLAAIRNEFARSDDAESASTIQGDLLARRALRPRTAIRVERLLRTGQCGAWAYVRRRLRRAAVGSETGLRASRCSG